MNSRQRRKDRRLYRWSIQERHYNHVGYIAKFHWCRATFGPLVTDGWRCRFNSIPVWQFDSEQKLTLFILKWVK